MDQQTAPLAGGNPSSQGSAAPDTSTQTPTQAPAQQAPASSPQSPLGPEPSLRQRFEAKAKELAQKRAKTEAKPASPAPAAQDPAKAAEPSSTEEPKVPAWSPNFKFKVLDKEHEIPEWARQAMKDADSEKQVREIFELAEGLKVVKPRFQSLKENHKQLQEQHTQLAQTYQGLASDVSEAKRLYQSGRMDLFFRHLNIPDEKILQYAAELAEYYQLPPEQRQVWERGRQNEIEAYEAQNYAKGLQSQNFDQVTQARGRDLQSELAKPDVQGFQAAFDGAFGQGAFWQAICERGEVAYATRKDQRGQPVDLSAAEAVKEVMEHYGKVIKVAQAPAPQAQAPTAPPATTAPAPEAQPQAAAKPATPPPAQPPVIPNVSGKAMSAASKPKFTSIDQLKEHRKRLSAG